MKIFRTVLALTVTLVFCASAFQSAMAEGIDDPGRQAYYALFKDKKVVFLPVAMGLDLTEGWAATIRKRVESLGMKFEIRDPNWSTDAGAQALTSLISEKPDVIVVHNPDVNSYAKLLKKAEKAGIYVIQVNMKSSYPTSAFVGADYVGLGEASANEIVKHCGPGTSGKVAIVQGVITAAASALNMKGIENVLSQHPEITIVSNQAADWDATKARNITATVLQQHPDLCGIIGFWDVMDSGTAAAVLEFQKRVKRDTPVFLITSGGGAKFACDGVASGMFSEVISYDVLEQGRDIYDMIEALLQEKQEPGASKVTLYSPLKFITKDTLTPCSCWDPEELKK